MRELYFSIDIECDGPIPARNSMISIGAVAINEKAEKIGEYSANLKPLEDCDPEISTTAFWKNYPEAYRKSTEGARDPIIIMKEFYDWVKSFKAEKNVFVAYPAGFDYQFINWYFMTLLGKNPFSFNILDIRSFAMGILGVSFGESSPDKLPLEWQSDLPHTHVAIEDARQQADIFIAAFKASKEADYLRAESAKILSDNEVPMIYRNQLAKQLSNFKGTRSTKFAV